MGRNKPQRLSVWTMLLLCLMMGAGQTRSDTIEASSPHPSPPKEEREILSPHAVGRGLGRELPERVRALNPRTSAAGVFSPSSSGGGGWAEEAIFQPGSWGGVLLASTSEMAHSKAGPLFDDVSAQLGHQHHDELFDDFDRQNLLYHRLSQLGPGITWADLNGNGHEQLIIASGKGGAAAIFEYAGPDTFKRLNLAPLTQGATRDQTTILSFPKPDGTTALLVGLANYEDGLTSGPCLYECDLSRGVARDLLVAQPSSLGPMALGDIDGDGDLDLFVGGRVVPGQYPERASSLIFENRSGQLVLDQANSAVLKNVGLVSGAVWTDLDGDGYPELVLACEWGPVKIFQNEKGRLRDATARWGLADRIGWWNGVVAGDFDGDGRMDLAVSNWGLNTPYQVRNGHGPRLYFGAWGGNGEIEPVEAWFDPEVNKWLPRRDLNAVSQAMPWVRGTFATHLAYADAGIEGILGEHLKQAQVLEANWLETTIFLNRGDHFELGSLPICAQFSPAFGVNVADFDGDGNEDLFLSQNFFDVQRQVARNDAGRGLLLRGNGKGGFSAVDGSVSGIEVYGEQRGSAVGDYDQDGRPDLAVTQNGGQTKLFHNIGAKPGLRVRLKGPAGNPQGVGAVIRLGFGEHWGPAREIHAGSGYWSQDSPVQVMATPEAPSQIRVRWPGGKSTETAVPKGTREVEVRQP